VLVLCALASLLGGGLLVGERQGVLTLRRVPSVILLPMWQDEKGETVAIVNTDVTPGSFLLICDEETTDSQQVWVPARSFVLRRRHREGGHSDVTLYQGRAQDKSKRVFYSDSSYRLPPRIVSRGSVVPLEWESKIPNPSKGFFEIVKQPGVSLVPAAGLTIGDERRFWATRHDGRQFDVAWNMGGSDREASLPEVRIWTSFRWDGVKPVMVDVDSTTPAPSVYEVWAYFAEGQPWDFMSKAIVIHDPDMTVIDERDAR